MAKTVFSMTQSGNSGDVVKNTSDRVLNKTSGDTLPSNATITGINIQITNTNIYSGARQLYITSSGDRVTANKSFSVSDGQTLVFYPYQDLSYWVNKTSFTLRLVVNNPSNNAFNVRNGAVWSINIFWELPYTKVTSPTKTFLTDSVSEWSLAGYISGAKDGTNNVVNGYIFERNLNNTGWVEFLTIDGNKDRKDFRFYPPDNAGDKYQYRVRAKSSLDSEWWGNWVTFPTTFTKNTKSYKPNLIIGNKKTFNKTPFIKLEVLEDKNGDKQRLFVNYVLLNDDVSIGEQFLQLELLPVGKKEMKVYLQDYRFSGNEQLYATNSELLTFEIEILNILSYKDRNIVKGTLLNGVNFSGSTDLKNVLNMVNIQRAYYGLSEIVFLESLKHFHSWYDNLNILKNGVDEIRVLLGKSEKEWLSQKEAPSASLLNEIIDELTRC